MKLEVSPKERLTKIAEILAEGVLGLIASGTVLESVESLLRRFMVKWRQTSSITTISQASSSDAS